MMKQSLFVELCVNDLLEHGFLKEETLRLYEQLPEHLLPLWKPLVLWMLGKPQESCSSSDSSFTEEERLSACRLIPLGFGFHTSSPTWSSHRLQEGIKASMNVPGASLSDICLAHLLISEEYSTPFNSVLENYCLDFSRTIFAFWREQLSDLSALSFWNVHSSALEATTAYFRYLLVSSGNSSLAFFLQTLASLSEFPCWFEIAEDLKDNVDSFDKKELIKRLPLVGLSTAQVVFLESAFSEV